MPTGPAPANVIFQRWTGGDVGRSRPLKSALDQFRGLNVWTYPNGAIGPRPPWQDCGITGLPQRSIPLFDVVKNVQGTAEAAPVLVFAVNQTPPTTGAEIWVASSVHGSAASNEGATVNYPLASAVWGGAVYYIASFGNGSSYDIFTTTVTDRPDIPSGLDIAPMASRMVIANAGGISGQLRVSAADDPNTWPVGNFINVGAPTAITGLFELRNALAILRYDGTVWQITGVPTAGGVLRKVDVGYAPPFQFRARGAVAGQSNLWWTAGRSMCKFTGAQLITVDRPDIPILPADKATYSWSPSADHVGAVLPLPEDDEFIVLGTLDLLSDLAVHKVWSQVYRARDQWTRHSIPITPFRFGLQGSPQFQQGSRDDTAAIAVPKLAPNGVAYFVINSDTAGASSRGHSVYRLNTQQEFPHISVGTRLAGGQVSSTLNDADSAAPVLGQFTTAEVWAEDQQYVRPPFTMLQGDGWSTGFTQVRVRSVEVDLSYDASITPHSTYNKFSLSVESVQRDSTAGEALAASTPQAYVAPTVSAPDPDGDGLVRTRVKFQVGDQGWGSGFRVRLADWTGIMVHRISCLVDLDGPRY